DERRITLVDRPDGERNEVERDAAVDSINERLDEIYAKLYADAERQLEKNIREASSRNEILGLIGEHGGYVKAPWCGDESCETEVKEQVAAEIVMIPLDESGEGAIPTEIDPEWDSCAICDDDAHHVAYFAKTY
ncbi:MAG: proline--tRNA ligase, partial [Halobacteriaceae archaeon]